MVRDIGRDSVFEDEDGDGTYEQTEGDGIAPPSVDTEEASITNVESVVYLSANQSVGNNTATKIAFDSAEDEDTDVLDADLANNVINVQVGGVYIIVGQLFWDSATGWSTGDTANINVRINGSLVNNPGHRKVSASSEGVQVVHQTYLAAGDTIRIDAFQDSGGSKTVEGVQTKTRLQIGRLG